MRKVKSFKNKAKVLTAISPMLIISLMIKTKTSINTCIYFWEKIFVYELYYGCMFLERGEMLLRDFD